MLEHFLTRYQLPALAAATVKNGKVVAVGTHKAGVHTPVTVHNRFHLGSNTKAVTALLAAMFVEAGKHHWYGTIVDVFPGLAEKMDAGLRSMTFERFLSHTSDIPSDHDVFGDVLEKNLVQDGNLSELRYWVV